MSNNSQTPEPGTERTLRTRNPRRRQRNDEDSVKTAPRRKRSKISDETFTPAKEGEGVNGHAEMNGTTRSTATGTRNSTPLAEMEMPVRSKKKASERHRRADGAVVLTQNQCYSVKLLPSIPKELKGKDIEYRASVSTAKPRALAITHTHAYIWDYTVHAAATTVRTFDVPFQSKAGDPLPFGALVATGASPEIGLVLVSATNGSVTYYDSIERAVSLSIFPDRAIGVNGSIGSLFSSEQVTDLVPADHAGFIITLSSGRLVHLTLRDAQGKPRVQGQLLRANDQAQSGWFGSVRGLLGAGAWKQDVASVRTRALGTKGPVQVASVTESAQLKVWDLDWSGHHMYKSSVDFKEQLVAELKSEETPEMQGRAEQFAVLDFALVDKPQDAKGREIATAGAEQLMDIVTLVSVGYPGEKRYSLVNLSVLGDRIDITRLVQLNKYHGNSSSIRPKVRLPKPGHTAYAIFEDAVVLVAMADVEMDSLEAQLQGSYTASEPFQDPVYLRRDQGIAMLASCEEEGRSGQASVLAFIKSSGLVRFSAVDPVGDVERSTIPVKNKIEQAVFHGMMQDNPIDFQKAYAEARYPPDSVEDAALHISKEILTSDSPYLTAPATFVEAHLTQRAQALQCLATHLVRHHGALSRTTTWKLLWDAEKVAAAQAMWQKYQGHVEDCSKGERKKQTLLQAVTDHLQDRFKFKPVDDADEDDLVRRFFIRGLDRLEKMLPAIYNIVSMLREEIGADKAADSKLLRLMHEADDLWLGALDAVHRFREEYADEYGMPSSTLTDGILIAAEDYQELPEFWTSSGNMLKAVVALANSVRETAQITFDVMIDGEVEPAAAILATETPSLVQLCCLTFQERILWCSASIRSGDRKMAEELRIEYVKLRHDLLRELAGVGQAQHAMRLCEKYGDLKTLTELVLAEMTWMQGEEQSLGPEGKALLKITLDTLQANISRYFDKYGDEWSNIFFDYGFSKIDSGVLFDLAQKHWQEHLTRYLRGNPARARLCWMNDVNVDGDFAHAAQCLKQAAAEQEDLRWAQKVEYSMSKLALLASQEAASEVSGAAASQDLRMPDAELQLVSIQSELVSLLFDTVKTATDSEAIKQVMVEDHGKGALDNKTPALRSQLAADFQDLMSEHKSLPLGDLIDVLTLMDHIQLDTDSPPSPDDPPTTGYELTMALRALRAANPIYPAERTFNLLSLVWKRVWLADDWAAINSAIKTDKLSKTAMVQKLAATRAWSVLFHAYTLDLFTTDVISVLQPKECIGAGSDTQELRQRYGDGAPDAVVDGVARDNQLQDKKLVGFVSDHRLDRWAGMLNTEVKKAVFERKGRDADEQEEERLWAQGFVEPEINGHEDGMNGYGNGEVKREDLEGQYYDEDEEEEGESGIEGEELKEDGDGDVEMA